MKGEGTNRNLNKIAIGTVQFGLNYGIANPDGQTSEKEAEAILQVAGEHGIDTIDTAVAYGNSEAVLGKLGIQKGWKVISKFPKTDGNTTLRLYTEQSLDHLKLDKLYAYIAHNAQVLLNKPNLWEQLEELKSKGLIEKKGYSIYTPEELEQLLDFGFIPELIQVPYNILDRRFESYFPKLKNMGAEIHTRSSFLQGLFFMKAEELSPYFEEIKPFIREFDHSFSDNKDKAAHLLDFCLAQDNVDRVVIGVNTADQLVGNIEGIHSLERKRFQYPVIDNEDILLPYNWPKN